VSDVIERLSSSPKQPRLALWHRLAIQYAANKIVIIQAAIKTIPAALLVTINILEKNILETIVKGGSARYYYNIYDKLHFGSSLNHL